MRLERWALGVAEGCLAEALPRRWAHVQGVAARARRAGSLVGADAELLTTAALLHDVGYAPELVDTGFHPIDGARYLQTIDAPERLVGLVAHHSCAVVEAELRGLADVMANFVDERTAVRDALWWADITTTPVGEATTFADRVAEVHRRYGREDVVSHAIRLASPELRGAVERTEARFQAAGIGQV